MTTTADATTAETTMTTTAGTANPSAISAMESATMDSLTEVMSRDPERYTDQDLARVIATMREQRARLAAAEVKGGESAAKKLAKTGPRAGGPEMPIQADPDALGI